MRGEPELWAWMVLEKDGRWGVLAGAIFSLDAFGAAKTDAAVPMVTGSERVAKSTQWRRIAAEHRRKFDRPVKLWRFDSAVEER